MRTNQGGRFRFDINEIGEMHHNPAKNVLYVRASVEEISKRMGIPAGAGGKSAFVGHEKNVCGALGASHSVRR